MPCQIERSGNEIVKVWAPGGKPSLLFEQLQGLLRGNKEAALQVWAQAYTPQFLLRHGDWRTGDVNITLDEHGEPLPRYLELPAPQSKADTALSEKIKRFLAAIGIAVEEVADVLPQGAVAQADLLHKVIRVVRDRADMTTLPEEAAHFFIRMLPRDSSFRKELLEAATAYPIYKDVLAAYHDHPDYQLQGKPHFEKLKEEAAAKLIAQAMLDPGLVSENVTKVKKARGLVTRLLDYIRGIFRKTNLNQHPFMTASEQILAAKVEGLTVIQASEEDRFLYQLSSSKTAAENFQALTAIDNRLEKKDTTQIDPETGKPLQQYFMDGKPVKRRVTDGVKAFYQQVFGKTPIDNAKREIYNLQAEKGTAIHADIENIGRRYVQQDGLLRNFPLPPSGSPQTNSQIYGLLEKNISDRLKHYVNRYGPDTRFLFEVKIYDPTRDMAGTIDLVVLKPNGRVDILDWKSMDFHAGKLASGIPWWKEEAYTLQLDEYAAILKTQYQVETDLKRAIPIRAIFSKNANSKKYTDLYSIEIGATVVSDIPADKPYLLPVPSRTEATGLKQLDDLLDQLRTLHTEIKDRKVSLDERLIKTGELEKIKRAITAIQVGNSLDGLIENGLLLKENIENSLAKGALELPQAQTYYKEIQLYTSISKLMSIMEKEGYGKSLPEDKKAAIYSLQGAAIALEDTLKSYLLTAANKVAGTVGVKGVQDIEKEVGWWTSMVRSISGSPNATVQTFYKYLTSFQDHIYQERDENNDRLETLKKKLLQWATNQGIARDKIFDGILEIDEKGRWNGSFIFRYSKQFRELKKKYIEDRNAKGLLTLLDLSPEMEEKFRQRQQKFKDWLNNTKFSLDAEKDKKIREKKEQDWNYQFNVFDKKYQEIALLNYNNGIPGKPTYFSTKWKALLEPTHAPLKEVYDYFQSLLHIADRELGMIDNNGRFIPSVENDKLDMWAQYGHTALFNMKGFFESFEYKTNAVFGEIDPITGKPKKSIPKLFLNNLGQLSKDEVSGETYKDFRLKSKDLFSVFSLWGKHMAEYRYMSQLEEIGHLMLTVEDIKGKHLQRGKDGKYVPVKGNETNLAYLQDFVDYYVYGRKLRDTHAWEFDLFGRTYSGKQLIQGMIRYMGMKTLAFNTLSIAANYAGGKFNTYFLATKGRFFNHRQWAHGEWAMSTDKGKALIQFFDVYLEDETFRRSRQLSVFNAVKHLSYDQLFIGQRATDKLVQYPVLLAMTQSYGVIDGKIVHLREYVQQQQQYDKIFELPVKEQQVLLAKIAEETAALTASHAIWNISKMENGQLVIPGITRTHNTVMAFRQLVKQANKTVLGNATTDDIARYRMRLLGQALGQFRNWMPAMIDERFGELRYQVDQEAWVQGKFRSYYSHYFTTTPNGQKLNQQILAILSRHIGTLVKDLIGFTSATDVQARAKLLYTEAKLRAAEQGLPFEIPEYAYLQLHTENMRAMLAEIRLILSFTACLFTLAGTGDDKEREIGITKYLTRMLDKFNNELLFYYVPTNFTQLIQSPIPMVSLLEDISKFFTHLAGEGYSVVIENPALRQKFKPTRYILKDIPIGREVYNLGTIFDEDMRRAYEVTN